MQPEAGTSLRSGWNLHFYRSIESWNGHCRAERSLPGRDRKLDLYVILADQFKPWVRLKSHMQVKIAGRRSTCPRLALPGEPNDGAVTQARWNLFTSSDFGRLITPVPRQFGQTLPFFNPLPLHSGHGSEASRVMLCVPPAMYYLERKRNSRNRRPDPAFEPLRRRGHRDQQAQSLNPVEPRFPPNRSLKST